MKKALILWITVLAMGCFREPRFRDDSTTSYVDILGKEDCYTESEKNAWLVDLKTMANVPITAKEIQFKGVTYKNVVKTYYDLSEQYSDTVNRYAITFTIADTTISPCNLNPVDIDPGESGQIPVARILRIGYAAQ